MPILNTPNIIIPRQAVASHAIMIACPCGAQIMIVGKQLIEDSYCPRCKTFYPVAVIKKMRYAAQQNGLKVN
jgi:hypothetical protein